MMEFLTNEWPFVMFTVFGSMWLTIPFGGKNVDDGGACLALIIIISVVLLYSDPIYAGIFLIIPCLFTIIAFTVLLVRGDDTDKGDTKAEELEKEVASLRSEVSRLAEALKGKSEK